MISGTDIQELQPKRKPLLEGLDFMDYVKLKSSGMFWEWYPEATGVYSQDCNREYPNHNAIPLD